MHGVWYHGNNIFLQYPERWPYQNLAAAVSGTVKGLNYDVTNWLLSACSRGGYGIIEVLIIILCSWSGAHTDTLIPCNGPVWRTVCKGTVWCYVVARNDDVRLHDYVVVLWFLRACFHFILCFFLDGIISIMDDGIITKVIKLLVKFANLLSVQSVHDADRCT